jgi:hypothetical protein
MSCGGSDGRQRIVDRMLTRQPLQYEAIAAGRWFA